ncbi:membrane-spanning 4-domains subfamily A member 8-like isoform X2 [Heptranchias perlo]|uniref:membrane-spanning 4-domains subfamily A member 8-like isoform X2 n=1 Tax=Heptranchias perlo TaxID=212740 RepID=UPI00355A5AF2
MAPSSPQQSPQQFNKQASPKAANAREVDDKTQHVSQEPTNIPVAVQVNCTSSADSSELWILRRELKALGATQILVGIIQIVFGVPLAMSLIYSVAGKSGVSFWTGIWYIISGSLTIELKRKPTRWIMKSGLLMNCVSAVATAIGVIIYSISLLFTPAPEFVYFSATTFSLTVALLLFTVLEMGIAVIIAFFNYRSLFQFENTYTILHDVITKHPSHSG